MLPEPGANQVEAAFEVVNQGHMRHEIEIALMTLNGNKFIGTIFVDMDGVDLSSDLQG